MEGWTRRTPNDWPELRSSPRPVIAAWVDGLGHAVTLYEEGLVDTDHAVPVELLPYIQAEWFAFLKGKVA